MLYDDFADLAQHFAATIASAGLVVRMNEPYSGLDGLIFSARSHGRCYSLNYLELEVNNRLLRRDADVRDYLEAQQEVAEYVAQVQGFLDTWLPKLRSETRSYVTVAFGCSGGRHRSVYLAERLARHCRETGWAEVAVHHRELD